MAWVWWLKEEETRDQVVKGLNPNPGAWSYKENFPRKITLMLLLSILIGWKFLSIQREETKLSNFHGKHDLCQWILIYTGFEFA